jgi:hypothetical protein
MTINYFHERLSRDDSQKRMKKPPKRSKKKTAADYMPIAANGMYSAAVFFLELLGAFFILFWLSSLERRSRK